MEKFKKKQCCICLAMRQNRSFQEGSNTCKYCDGLKAEENKKYQKEYQKHFRAMKKEEARRNAHEYYLKNKEKIVKNCAKWRKENPDKIREYCRRNYNKLKQAQKFAKAHGFDSKKGGESALSSDS